jgi:flagellin
MSMTRINTNADAMLASANLMKMEYQMSRTLSHLSTGLRIVTGADDPAGLGISSGMRAQLGGVAMAIQNAQDGLSMMSTADTALADNMTMLLRMRDIAVRASSDATLTTTQRQTMEQEYINLKGEIARRRTAITFNGKVLFSGAVSGKTIQIGPDNSSGYKFSIKIPLISVTFFGVATRTLSNAHVSQVGSAGKAIDIVQSCINGLAKIQAIVGSQEEELQNIINALSSEQVNLAAANSRVTDADMASEISNFAKQQIIAQAATAMIAQANAQPQSVMKLLGIG